MAKTRAVGMADEVLDFLRVNFARLNERIDRIEADMTEFASGSATSRVRSPGSMGCTPLYFFANGPYGPTLGAYRAQA